MKIMEFFHPQAGNRAKTFGIKKVDTIVDYACGPGRYTIEFAQLVGDEGKVFVADIKEIALREVERKAQSKGLKNIELRLAKGYDSSLDTGIARYGDCTGCIFHGRKPGEISGGTVQAL